MKREELYNRIADDWYYGENEDPPLLVELKRHLFRSDINVGIIVCRGGRIVSQEIEVPLLDGEYFVTIAPKE